MGCGNRDEHGMWSKKSRGDQFFVDSKWRSKGSQQVEGGSHQADFESPTRSTDSTDRVLLVDVEERAKKKSTGLLKTPLCPPKWSPAKNGGCFGFSRDGLQTKGGHCFKTP